VASSGLSRGRCADGRRRSATPPPGGDLTPGLWGSEPTPCGPFTTAAKSGKATDKATVATNAFNSAMTVSTGDLQQEALGAGAFTKVSTNIVELAPGATKVVDVTLKPAGKAGTVVKRHAVPRRRGDRPAALWRHLLQRGGALPYSYTIG